MLVVLIPDDSVWTDVLSLSPPELPPDEAVEHGQAKHGQEKEDAGGPDHDGEEPRADGVLRGSALVGAQGVRAVLVLDPHQDEDGSGANEGDGPEEEDDQLDLPLGDDHFSSEGEADGNVPLHAEGGDVEDGGVGAALADELEELAEEVPKVPGPVLPEAEEVQGHAEEDEQVGEGHAGQVEVGGGPHVPEPRHHQHGHEVADDPDDEEEDAGDGDAGEDGRGEKVQRGLGTRPVLRAAAARAPLPHPAAAGCASPPRRAPPRAPRSPAPASAPLRALRRAAGAGAEGGEGRAAPLRLSPRPGGRAGTRRRVRGDVGAVAPRARSGRAGRAPQGEARAAAKSLPASSVKLSSQVARCREGFTAGASLAPRLPSAPRPAALGGEGGDGGGVPLVAAVLWERREVPSVGSCGVASPRESNRRGPGVRGPSGPAERQRRV